MSSRSALLLVCTALLVELCSSSIGVSLSKKLDSDGWSSLLTTFPSVEFASVHMLFYNATINPHAVSTVHAAWEAGIRDLSMYMHPCMTSSFYSKSVNLVCPTAGEQLQSVLSTMHSNNMDFVRHPYEDSTYNGTYAPSASPTVMPTSSGTASTPPIMIQRLFVCFEDEVPNRFLSSTHRENVEFMLELLHDASMEGIQLGIYTTKNDWLNTAADITTSELMVNATLLSSNGTSNSTQYWSNTTYLVPGGQVVYHLSNVTVATQNPFSHLPLWTTRFDSLNSMDFYAPFGDWPRVLMKQVSGSTTALHRIGSDRVGMSFMDDELATMYDDLPVLEIVV